MLVKWEYNRIFLPLCIIIGVMAVVTIILFLLQLWRAESHMPLSYLLETAKIPTVMFVAFVLVGGLMGGKIHLGLASSTNYALFTLPIKRKRIYQARMTVWFIAWLVLYAAQMMLVLLFHSLVGWFETFIWLDPIFNGAGEAVSRRGADLYLTLLELDNSMIFFSVSGMGHLFNLALYSGWVCLTLYMETSIRARKIRDFSVILGVWIIIMLIIFP
jgi:hypothetical protein